MPHQPIILTFACQCCAYTAADVAGSLHETYPENLRLLRVPCAGKVEPNHVLQAFEQGIDGVIVAGCRAGECHFVDGNLRAGQRLERLQQLLGEIGLEPERLQMVYLASYDGARFAEIATAVTARVRELGPSPLRRAPPGAPPPAPAAPFRIEASPTGENE